jgi:hypothetical protein
MRLAQACLLAVTTGVLLAQTPSSPAGLYQRARDRVIEGIGRLPRYTCVQTITRHVYRNAPVKKSPDCEHLLQGGQLHKPALVSWDRLRIDVAIADQHEVFSWVGASRFEESDLSKLVGGGQTSMGDFGSLVLSVFENHPEMHFEGERKINGRRLLEFSYQTSQKVSHYEVRVGFERITTAYSGSVFLDADSGDLVRVTALSAVLPEQTGYCQVGKQLEYTHLRISSGNALIPSEAISTAIDRDEMEMSSASAYSECREYVGESVLRFDDPSGGSEPDSASPTSGSASAEVPREIPPGRPFDCRILSTIDSDTSAAGDPIEAVLRTPIADPGGRVLAPAGTRIHGRLIGFTEHPAASGQKESYEVQVQLRSLELNGKRVPIAANVANETTPARGAPIRLNLHPQSGSFIFYEKKLHVANIEAKWITARPATEPALTP